MPEMPLRTNSPAISVVLVEDNRLVREGLALLLKQVADIRIVAAVASTDVARLRSERVDIVLLDLGLRNGDSLRLTESLKQELPASRLIVMDLLSMRDELVSFVNAGVSGFILKDASLEELASCIRLVAQGISVLPAQMVGTLFTQMARDSVNHGRPLENESVRMTPREREVIKLIGDGLGNKEIAARLHIATHTAKSHVRNVMEKLTLHTRLQIAAYAHNLESSAPVLETVS
jgi:DNA-binding NarL/FixJ family response regulator